MMTRPSTLPVVELGSFTAQAGALSTTWHSTTPSIYPDGSLPPRLRHPVFKEELDYIPPTSPWPEMARTPTPAPNVAHDEDSPMVDGVHSRLSKLKRALSLFCCRRTSPILSRMEADCDDDEFPELRRVHCQDERWRQTRVKMLSWSSRSTVTASQRDCSRETLGEV